MKKRFLLAVLPALLVLSACQAGPKNKDNNIFLEDTLAHDEIFGAEKLEDRALMPRRLGDDPVVHPDNDPSIGVQSKIEDGKVSFRFVAAVTFSESNITPTNAVWTRTVSSPDGQTFPKDTGSFGCTTAYTKLSNGGSPYLIDDFNNAQNPKTSFTHFVVYTLRNIPLDSYSDYYVCAYLTLSGEGGLNQRTKAVAISVDQSKKYTHDPFLGVSFVTGTFGGNPGVVNATSIRTSEDDDNKAEFKNLSLSENDTFVINEFYNTKLYVKGASKFGGNSSYYFANNNGSIKANFAGKYNLFLNKSDEIHTTASDVVRPLYVSLKNVSWWTGDSAWTAIYAFNNSTNVHHWYKTSASGNYLVSSAAINPTIYDQIIVVRMKSESSNKQEDQLSFDDKYYNQTKDLEILDDETKDCVYVSDTGVGDNGNTKDASWGTR